VIEHLTAERIDRYRRGASAPADIAELFNHVAACDDCRHRMNDGSQLSRAYAALGPGVLSSAIQDESHLPAELLALYVDDEVDAADREIAESHIEFCHECRADVLDLRDIKRQFSYAVSRRQKTASRFSISSRIAAFSLRGSYRIALPATAVLLLLVLATLPLRKQIAELRTQIDELRQKSVAIEDQTDRLSELQTEIAQLVQSQAQWLNATAAVALHDGGGRLVTLSSQGELGGLATLPPQVAQLVKAALTTERVTTGAPRLRGKRELLMGPGVGGAFSVLGPAGITVQEDRPTFRWTALSGATSCVVTVYDPSSKAVATSHELSDTEWTLPRPLKRGVVYTWEVAATKDGKEIVSPSPPQPPARFKVLEHAKLDELELAKQTYPDSHLVLGVLYAQDGLFEDAEREFKSLLDANPNSSLAQKLLSSVKYLRKR
jgi:putative zinc finger protein